MNRIMTVIGLCAALFVVGVATLAMPSPWVPVNQDAWTLAMEEPQNHFMRAQDDLSRKDAKGAANEMRLAGTFLKIQEKRLEASVQQLNDLANDIESGKVVSAAEANDSFSSAIRVLDQRQAFLPVIEGGDVMYMDEADYHLAQAKIFLDQKDNKRAAGDIRRAAAYLKLKAVHAGEDTKKELSLSADELEELARKVDEGGAVAVADLDKLFGRARKAMRRVP
jgi:phage terminase Nu1 subunit (DNA packaging protein)